MLKFRVYIIFILLLISFNSFGKYKNTILFCEKHFIQNTDTILNAKANIAPVLTATGNQMYCVLAATKIVTTFTIVDPDDTGIDALYVQISSGYVNGQDLLTLTGFHPDIDANWNPSTGKLTLSGVSSVQPTYLQLVAAVKDIEFSNNTNTPTGVRTFSITVGQANYLPSNGHYYQYFPNLGITWNTAKNLAQASTYYGLQGYLATITSSDEAQLSGEQAAGAGWIGGSDEEVEGIWKWKTGPEAGTVFWNGTASGFTTTYAKWNTGEPNSAGDEDYAHVTAPGVGILGSWNDLSDAGNPSGDYQPKGYIVEYGGTSGDPILQISTSTTLTVPSITSTTTSTRCGAGSVTLEAVSNTGVVNWYDAPIGGTLVGTGNSFATPTIANNTDFYAVAHTANCSDLSRVAVTANVIQKPILTFTTPQYMCDGGYKVVYVATSSGIMYWYDSMNSTSPIFTGSPFVVPNIHQNTIFYAEANNNNCFSDRVAILVNVYPKPIATDESYEICAAKSIVLDAGNSGMTYLWSTGQTTQTINSNGLSNYSVVITTPAPESCSTTKNFQITLHYAPQISEVQIINTTATIITSSAGDFEYSIDGIIFQDSNVFDVFQGGLYTAYVREKNNCGKDSKEFVVLITPDFFTPNSDGYNDVWTIKGLENFPKAEIKIYDRFGKFITTINANKNSWDGTINTKPLPADDYWFEFKIDDEKPTRKGHFSLKR